MNRAGFTTVEVLIASALIIALITGGAMGFRQIGILNQFAATRTAHTEMRSRVIDALSDTGHCAVNLGQGTPHPPSIADFASPSPIELDSVSQYLVSGSTPVVKKGSVIDGLRYSLELQFPHPSYKIFPAGMGRPHPTLRYQAQLQIYAQRESLSTQSGTSDSKSQIQSRIPLSVEFDQVTGLLASCTLNPEDMDEILVAGPVQHTVRDCYRVDGVPIPTDMGLICRVPYSVPHTDPNYAGEIPSCASLVSGWANASPTDPNYNTTISTNYPVATCKGTTEVVTPWHTMSQRNVASIPIDVKTGEKNGGIWAWAGAGATEAIVASLGTPVGPAIVAVVAVATAVAWIVGSKCTSKTVNVYAQVNSVGCI